MANNDLQTSTTNREYRARYPDTPRRVRQVDLAATGQQNRQLIPTRSVEDCTYGLADFANYFGAAGFVPLANAVEGSPRSPREFVETYAATGNCCIGTPDDAIAYITDLLDRSGGFGTLLLLGHDWAPPAATYHCYELLARNVIPHFQGQLTAPRASHDWAKGMRDRLFGRAGEAIMKAVGEHTDELKQQAEQG